MKSMTTKGLILGLILLILAVASTLLVLNMRAGHNESAPATTQNP